MWLISQINQQVINIDKADWVGTLVFPHEMSTGRIPVTIKAFFGNNFVAIGEVKTPSEVAVIMSALDVLGREKDRNQIFSWYDLILLGEQGFLENLTSFVESQERLFSGDEQDT